MTRTSTGRGWKIVLGIIAGLLILLFIGEIAVRALIAQQIRAGISDSAPESSDMREDASVGFGASPVLLGLARGKLQHINIEVPSTLVPDSDEIIGNPPATIDATGFVLDQDNPTADELILHTEIPQALLRDMLQQELRHSLNEAQDGRFAEYDEILTVSDVGTDPAAGTFTVTFSNGAFGVELRPDVSENGQIAFTAESTQILGRNLPDFFSEAVSNALQKGLNEDVVGPMKIQQFQVIDNGFRITVAGENVQLSELPV
ncbi:Protein of unknown function [Corynebacterium appendicis CIP 107643]|uniref:DUF2993 domain-containing protein n=1 Tax=Corynebacterium appendicis CIP 107643 TaxID=1161099 RepID=A0A1N7IN10_9CORY|nr:LmeA family phospholipid-binding protein [Corynebacterium appendicis]WJY60159.1 hypothetical protein CAPP_01050 [Corynebacterium appendicis CIP 107643]SIS38454.1 Protein of unknown function [Corynebacterium appendicis CIP 107643]